MRSVFLLQVIGLIIISFAPEIALAACPPDPNEQNTGVICLIQPLDDTSTSLTIANGTATFENYFGISAPWIFNIAISFCIIWVLIGGIMYMSSGNDQGRRSAAVSRMTWAIVGLLMMIFAGFILKTLNSAFYV